MGVRAESDKPEASSIRDVPRGPKKTARDSDRPADEENAEWECNPRPSKRMRWTYSTRSTAPGPESEGAYTQGKPLYLEDGPMDILSQVLDTSFTTSTQTSTSSSQQLDCSQSHRETSFKITSRKLDTSGQALDCSKVGCYPRTQLGLAAHGESKEARILLKGILDSLMAMLVSTRGGREKKPSGCPSLFIMCLKRVPDHILEEEQWAMEDDPDSDLDISSMIYSDLEASAVAETWKPLRDIVRTHGVLLVERAIRDGTIHTDAALRLINLCVSRDAPDAAQSLLRTVIVRLSFIEHLASASKALLKDRALVLKQLWNFAQQTGRIGFLYQQLIYMLQSTYPWNLGQQLLRPSLSSAIKAVSSGRDDLPEAVGFISEIVRMSYVNTARTTLLRIEKLRQTSRLERKRTALRSRAPAKESSYFLGKLGRNSPDATSYSFQSDETDSPVDVPSFVAMISALSHAQSNGQEGSSCETGGAMPALLDALAIEAYQFHELAILGREGQDATYHLSMLFVEDYLRSSMVYDAMHTKPKIVPSGIDALSNLSLTDDDLKQLGTFIHNIARFYGQIKGIDAFDFISIAVNVLSEAAKSTTSCSATRPLLRKIAVASAFAFSEASGQPSRLDWALGVEQSMCPVAEVSPRRTFTTPAKIGAQVKQGYRWEDGICEWIVKTPALQLRQPRSAASLSGESDQSDDVPASITPMTSPASENTSMLGSFTRDEPQELASSAEVALKNDHASLKCVRITSDNLESVSKKERPISTAACSMTEERPRISKVYQEHEVYDDTDELSAAHYADRGAAMFPLRDVRDRPREQYGTIRGKREPQKTGSGIKAPASRHLGRRAIPATGLEFADGESSSDAEDELSFS